jgi:hypothetical protein
MDWHDGGIPSPPFEAIQIRLIGVRRELLPSRPRSTGRSSNAFTAPTRLRTEALSSTENTSFPSWNGTRLTSRRSYREKLQPPPEPSVQLSYSPRSAVGSPFASPLHNKSLSESRAGLLGCACKGIQQEQKVCRIYLGKGQGFFSLY